MSVHEHIYEYYSPPGVKRKTLKGPMRGSPRQLVDALGKHRIASAAADYGAITVWRDDAGKYHASFQRSMSTLAEISSTSRGGLLPTVKSWWPAMKEYGRAVHTPKEARP